MPISSISKPSKAKIVFHQGSSRLVDCESVSPMRFLHPYFSDQAACLILSSYGGGLVQGDQISIEIECDVSTTLFMGTQANSRVYRNDQGYSTTHSLHVEVAQHAKVISLPEPLVLHGGSQFHQKQKWNLQKDAAILLGEWFQCGRSDSGERFAYDFYDSLIEIRQEGELLLREPFLSKPDPHPPNQTGCFGDANLLLNLYAVGEAQELLLAALEPFVAEQSAHTQVPALGQKVSFPAPDTIRSLVELEHAPITIFRMLGKTRMDFDPVWQALGPLLATEKWLGKEAKLPMCRQDLS